MVKSGSTTTRSKHAHTDGNAALFQSKFLFVLAANQKDCLAAARDLGYTAGAIGYNFNIQLKDVELLR